MTQKSKGSLNGEHSPEPQLTPEQVQRIIQIGEEASALLGSPVYNMAYQQLLQTNFQTWLATDPKEERKRESLYHQTQGLVQVTEQLAGAVEDARRLLENQAAEQDPQRRQQNYEDTQGFGLNFN